MEEKNDFQDDEARRSKKDEEAIRSECSEQFEKFAGHLQELLSCQDSLERLSFHTERLFRHHLLLQAGRDKSRARQIEGSPLGSGDGGPTVRKAQQEWEDNLDSLEGKVLPLVHPQIDGIHWQKILQQARAIEDAVRRLCHTDDLPPEDVAEIQRRQHSAQMLREEEVQLKQSSAQMLREAEIECEPYLIQMLQKEAMQHETQLAQMLQENDWRNKYEKEVWTFRTLHRDIESLVPLIRAVAAVCQVTGDFGDARERQSAARVAHISAQLTQCASDMAQDASYFSFYVKIFPKSRLKNEQAWLVKDLSLVRHASRSLRGKRKVEWDSYTPPVIAAMMKLTPETVMKYIVKMEESYKRRTKRQIAAMEKEMKAEGRDPKVSTYERDAKIEKINEEGKKELTPREKEGKSRRAFSWKQVEKIAGYYDDTHSRWVNRKDREKSLPESPE